jgi:hypothetical protein
MSTFGNLVTGGAWEDIATGKTVVYRGHRGAGDPMKLKGPRYFTDSESFAQAYGPSLAYRLNLKKPLVIRDVVKWYPFNLTTEDAVKALKKMKGGYDSVLYNPAGTMWVVFLLDAAKQATVLPGVMT